MGCWAQGSPGEVPEGSPGGPKKGPRKKAARERAVKTKIGEFVFLEKRRE
jgi:hypothetical protein